MIQIIKNIFKTKEKYSESNVEIKLDKEELEKTKDEVFDEKLKVLIDTEIKNKIKSDLIKYCYYKEEISDTEKAKKEYPILYNVLIETVREKYPNFTMINRFLYC